ncbi:MAG: DUF4132 domain-containing protein [Candidatus Limnocylindrales bacterium]
MDRVGDVLELLDELPDDEWTGTLRAPLELPAGRAALDLPDHLVPSLAGHLLERIVSLGWAWHPVSTRGQVERRILSALARSPRRWATEDVELLLRLTVRLDPIWLAPELLDLALAALERHCSDEPIGPLEPLVRRLLENVEGSDARLATGVRARLRRRLSSVLAARADAVDVSLVQPTDGWGVAMREWLERESPPAAPTNALVLHFSAATSVNPTVRWQSACVRLLADHPQAGHLIRAMLDTALAHTGHITLQHWETRGVALVGDNAALIRGAAWAAEVLRPTWLADTVGRLGLHYGMSPRDDNFARDEKVASTCAALLGRLDADGAAAALGRMKATVRSRAVLKQVDAALGAISQRTGTPVWQLQESAVPTFGLDESGRKAVVVGEAEADVSVDDDGRVHVTWRTSEGQVTPKPPASIAKTWASRIATLRGDTKEIEKTLATERSRLEALLIAPRSWTATAWRARYLSHPLTRPWARRLLWQFEDATSRQVGMPVADAIEGLDGRVAVGPETTVRLWHPIAASASEVEAWRAWLMDRRLRQPFKQAFREVYRLAPQEAEGTSSGRFGGRVLHYPQASALMSARRWSANQLGFWDGGFDAVAKRTFESHAIRAEFDHQLARDESSITREVEEREARLERSTPEPVDVDELVARLVEAARHHSEQPTGTGYEDVRYCRTGEVRFFRADDRESVAPLPLREIPAEVFSEAMRDVDLFSSVASVAVDQLWHDRDEPRISIYRDLSAFAVLPESAQTRRDVLQRLIPRSRIADRCTFEERYLRVRGDLRTYRIHLGSAQVLMEPNDEHLFVRLPGGPAAAEANGVFMPFEDTLLGHVLANAFLLAEDAKIRDDTIRRQITAG